MMSLRALGAICLLRKFSASSVDSEDGDGDADDDASDDDDDAVVDADAFNMKTSPNDDDDAPNDTKTNSSRISKYNTGSSTNNSISDDP